MAITTKCAYVTKGFGQVEPNHLSAQHTGQIFAQLPAKAGLELLENGQFVKYDYANKEVNFSGAGEWMLVYNEVKVYRDYQGDKDFAMIADNYGALVYAAHNGVPTDNTTGNVNWKSAVTQIADPYEVDSTNNPMQDKVYGDPEFMHGGYTYDNNFVNGVTEGTAKVMVPRVLKTNVGDIFTTNTIAATQEAITTALAKGPVFLAPNGEGYLAITESEEGMRWQVVKVYTMPDGQPGVKIMRIA